MTIVRQTAAAVALVTLSLWMQRGGMAALIGWARTSQKSGWIAVGDPAHILPPD